MEDQALIARIQAKDQDAMLLLHARYANLVYSIAYRVLSEQAAAEEATQDTFMKVWLNAASYAVERGAVPAWLTRIARNVAIDRLRSRTRQTGRDDDSVELSDESHALPIPNDWQNARERLPELRSALEQLPPEQAQVIALAYFGGLSQSDIALQLSLPLGTVKTRMRLGLQRLRDAWVA